MVESSKADRAAYVKRWRTAAPLLHAHRLLEIRQLTLQQRQKQIDNLLNLGFQFRVARTDDGLVRLNKVLCEVERIKNGQS